MATRLVLNHWEDWLEPGNSDDTRLLHADVSDRILVVPSDLGQGYFQEIVLRDDLILFIHDYSLHQDLIMDTSGGDRLEFAFSLVGSSQRSSCIVPEFGWKTLAFKRAKKRFFKVEIFFKRPTLITYLQAFIERLSPQTRNTAEQLIQLMYRYHGGGVSSTKVAKLNRIFDRSTLQDPHFIFEQIVTTPLYAQALDLGYATSSPVTPVMEQVIGQILSCPYQGAVRRNYLEQKALKLVSLRLDAMVKPYTTKKIDLSCIHQAAVVLRNHLVHPPTVEALARQVGTNRLYLNQGFAQVYGTTPYGYLRSCRLWHARRLLMASDLSISNVATSVGYTCRSHFATAFRQLMGMNPKAFQMQAWQRAS